jgi:hypothetical protein
VSDVHAELESLRRENARLRKLLKLTDAEAAPALGTQTAWFDRAPGPVDARSSPQAKVEFYATLFGARRDVYAVRWDNARTGRSGWMPAVEGGWRKGRPASEVRHLPLTSEVLAAHLTGDVHIGLYPMLPGDQTCWLAADFDGAAAMLDALAYLKAARSVGAPAALEVSRSGIGAHVWISFTDPVSAATARQLGTALVREAIAAAAGWTCAATTDSSRPKTFSPGRVRGARVHHAQPARSTKTQPNPATLVHLRLDGTVSLPRR